MITGKIDDIDAAENYLPTVKQFTLLDFYSSNGILVGIYKNKNNAATVYKYKLGVTIDKTHHMLNVILKKIY